MSAQGSEKLKNAERRIGVFVMDDAQTAIDLDRVAEAAAALPGVVAVQRLASAAKIDPEKLSKEVRGQQLDGVVIAGAHPGFVEPAFARALALSGGDGGCVTLASFAERSTCVTTEAAIAALSVAVSGAPSAPLTKAQHAVNAATLVIGAGVAGIQASLEIAASGNKVYLVERTDTIGGRMAMFDKTFPTLDCAACILTPKMVSAGQNANIELLMRSEVKSVTGTAGAFQVEVLKHTTRVDAAQCVACGECARFCPTVVTSEFDMGIATRKAISIPFPQAVPNTYAVDEEHCQWILSGGKKCGACMKKCAKNAIHMDAPDETVTLTVGNIIVATGYEMLDASLLTRYGYGALPNVLTSLEFERLSNASGPTGGKITLKGKKLNKRTKQEEWVFEPEGEKPKAVAIVHCAGSRDRNQNAYCSRVCCMYSLKFAHLVKEKLPDAECYEYYIDMRAFGKGYEEFHERIREEGVHVLRGRPASVSEQNGRLLLHGENVETGAMIDQEVDMVILSAGLKPSAGAGELAQLLGIERDGDGWLRELDYNAEPTATAREGIYVAGVCQGPKDIPDTVAQASAAAAGVLRTILGAKAAQASAAAEETTARV